MAAAMRTTCCRCPLPAKRCPNGSPKTGPASPRWPRSNDFAASPRPVGQPDPDRRPIREYCMDDRARLEIALARTIEKYGEWIFDIPLPYGLWTRTDDKYPHTRLRRIVQIIRDTSPKPLSECRIVDLGCLDGLYSLE